MILIALSIEKMYIRLRVRCHLCPIWPPVLALYRTYILIVLSQLPWANLPYTRIKSHVHFLQLRSFMQRIRAGPRTFVTFRNKLIFYDEELLAQRPNPKLEDHTLSAVRDCLFSIFAATLHIWRSPPSATWGRAMPLVTKDPPNITVSYLTFLTFLPCSLNGYRGLFSWS
jgi:hypothetical protein